MNTCIMHLKTAILAALAACQGAISTPTPTPQAWHGRAQMVDVRAGNGEVHVRSTPGDEVEVRARSGRDGEDCALRVVRRGRAVIVYADDLGGGALDVYVPQGVGLRASADDGS